MVRLFFSGITQLAVIFRNIEKMSTPSDTSLESQEYLGDSLASFYASWSLDKRVKTAYEYYESAITPEFFLITSWCAPGETSLQPQETTYLADCMDEARSMYTFYLNHLRDAAEAAPLQLTPSLRLFVSKLQCLNKYGSISINASHVTFLLCYLGD